MRREIGRFRKLREIFQWCSIWLPLMHKKAEANSSDRTRQNLPYLTPSRRASKKTGFEVISRTDSGSPKWHSWYAPGKPMNFPTRLFFSKIDLLINKRLSNLKWNFKYFQNPQIEVAIQKLHAPQSRCIPFNQRIQCIQLTRNKALSHIGDRTKENRGKYGRKP